MESALRVWSLEPPAEAVQAFKQFAARPPRSVVSRPRRSHRPAAAKARKKALARLCRERGVKTAASLAARKS